MKTIVASNLGRAFLWFEWGDTLLPLSECSAEHKRAPLLHSSVENVGLSHPPFSLCHFLAFGAESCRNGSIIVCSKISVSVGFQLLWLGIWLVYCVRHPKIIVLGVSCNAKEGEWWVYGSWLWGAVCAFCPERRRRKWQQQCGSQPARFLLSPPPPPPPSPSTPWPDSIQRTYNAFPAVNDKLMTCLG